jgi:hypothetical protein
MARRRASSYPTILRTVATISSAPLRIFLRCMNPVMAHRDISRRRSNSVVFGAKRTFCDPSLQNSIYEYAASPSNETRDRGLGNFIGKPSVRSPVATICNVPSGNGR